MRSTIDSAFKFAYTDSEITRKQKENYANVAENEFADRARVLSNLPYYISND